MAEGEPEFLTVGQARALLGVSKRAITRLIEDGTLASEPNPFDKRSKLVRRADVLALKTKMPPKMPPKKAAA
jgi:excisionase family DNA binding protein